MIKMIKSRRMRMGRRGTHIGYWWVNLKKETTGKTKM
jgi:hypothetical protein